jgi:hypothetical protein
MLNHANLSPGSKRTGRLNAQDREKIAQLKDDVSGFLSSSFDTPPFTRVEEVRAALEATVYDESKRWPLILGAARDSSDEGFQGVVDVYRHFEARVDLQDGQGVRITTLCRRYRALGSTTFGHQRAANGWSCGAS